MKYSLVISILILLSCTTPQTQKVLYLHKMVLDGKVRKDTLYAISDKLFEINTSSLTYQDGTKKYIAKKNGEMHSYDAPLHMEEEYIVNAKDSIEWFKDAAAFLTYMDAHDFQVVSQKEMKHGANYMFKRNEANGMLLPSLTKREGPGMS